MFGAHKLGAGDASTLAGFLLVIAAAVAWAAGNVIAKRRRCARRRHVRPGRLVKHRAAAALSYTFEGGAAAWQAVTSASALSWGCVLFLAWAATLFGFAQWAGLLHRYPTALISPFALLIAVSGLASGALLLGEALPRYQWRACCWCSRGFGGECPRRAAARQTAARPLGAVVRLAHWSSNVSVAAQTGIVRGSMRDYRLSVPWVNQ